MTLSDRLAVMRDGRLEQVGTPEEIYRDPETEFVANFIGDTNLLPGTAHTDDGDTVVEVCEGFSFATTGRVREGPVRVSIRPEDFSLADGDGDLTGVVAERYFQGDRTSYVVDPEAADLPSVTVVMQGRGAPVASGERASFAVDEGAPVVFEA